MKTTSKNFLRIFPPFALNLFSLKTDSTISDGERKHFFHQAWFFATCTDKKDNRFGSGGTTWAPILHGDASHGMLTTKRDSIFSEKPWLMPREVAACVIANRALYSFEWKSKKEISKGGLLKEIKPTAV